MDIADIAFTLSTRYLLSSRDTDAHFHEDLPSGLESLEPSLFGFAASGGALDKLGIHGTGLNEHSAVGTTGSYGVAKFCNANTAIPRRVSHLEWARTVTMSSTRR